MPTNKKTEKIIKLTWYESFVPLVSVSPVCNSVIVEQGRGTELWETARYEKKHKNKVEQND